jgi:hypothetical protein
MSKRKRYSNEDVAGALLILEAAGYPDKHGAMTAAVKATRINDQTLRRWWNRENGQEIQQVVAQKRGDLIDAIRDELWSILDEAETARGAASYRELLTAFGILVDKLQLLTGKATERTEFVTDEFTDEQRASRIAVIFERARTRRDNGAGAIGSDDMVRH